MRRCQSCGRQLRTGRKWCYDCKSGGRLNRKNKAKKEIESELWIIFIFGLGFFYFAYQSFISGNVLLSIVFGAVGIFIFWSGFKFNNKRAKKYREEYKKD